MDFSEPDVKLDPLRGDFIAEYSRGANYNGGKFDLAHASGDIATRLDLSPDKLDEWFDEKAVRLWASKKSIVPKSDKGDKLYHPITDPYEIRVLELKPGVGDEPLRASLRHCSVEYQEAERVDEETGDRSNTPTIYALSMDDLTTPVAYTALSYTWGPPVFDGRIECDGHIRNVTLSLETALRHFRRKDYSVVMWIDQLCINQEDMDEKAQQIPLMGRIYKHALNTVVWLGQGNAGSESAIRLLGDLNYYLQFTDAEINPSEFERLCLPSPDDPVWREVWELFSRAWFTRVWIIQEAVISRELWLVCGKSLVRWEPLTIACNHLTTCGLSRWMQEKFAPGFPDACMMALNLSEVKTDYYTLEAHPRLFTLLSETRSAQCYDPRDKIYGLLGVCLDSDRDAVKVSYADDCTPAMLYREMTANHLKNNTSGWSLSLVLAAVDHHDPDIPSWVTDWRIPRQTIALGAQFSRAVYNACGRFGPVAGKVVTSFNEDDPDELRVKGVVIDTLAEVSDIFTEAVLSRNNPTIENKALVEAANFAGKLEKYPDGFTVFDAFWNTLVAGKDGTGRLKCPSSFAEIFSFLLDESTGRSPSLPDQSYSARQKRPKGKGRLELPDLGRRAAGKTFDEISTAVGRALKNRRLGITAKGYLGLFPRQSIVGDDVYVFDSCHVPLLLRASGDCAFRLVGECFVYGVMNGEAMADGGVSMSEVVLK